MAFLGRGRPFFLEIFVFIKAVDFIYMVSFYSPVKDRYSHLGRLMPLPSD